MGVETHTLRDPKRVQKRHSAVKAELLRARRNFGSRVTAVRPSAPQAKQCEMTYFGLYGSLQPLFNLMIDMSMLWSIDNCQKWVSANQPVSNDQTAGSSFNL